MKMNIGSTIIHFDPLFVFWISLLLIIDKSGLAVIVMLASIAHEIGHLVVMALLKNAPKKIEFRLFAITVEQKNNIINYPKELLICSAGILTNLSLAVLFYTVHLKSGSTSFYYCFLSNLAIGLFNLIPLKALDGGEILRILLLMISKGKTSGIIENSANIIFMVLGVFAGGYIFYKYKNLGLLLFCFYSLFFIPLRKNKVKLLVE